MYQVKKKIIRFIHFILGYIYLEGSAYLDYVERAVRKMFVVDACQPVKKFVNQEEACHAVKNVQEACRAALYSPDPSTSPRKVFLEGVKTTLQCLTRQDVPKNHHCSMLNQKNLRMN